MQAILSYKEDLFTGIALTKPVITIDVCGLFWKTMPEVADFLAEEIEKFRIENGRTLTPYIVKMTPDWGNYSVRIRITEFNMACDYAQRLIQFIKRSADKKIY